MIQKIKNIFVALAMITTALMPVLVPAAVSAESVSSALCKGTNIAASGAAAGAASTGCDAGTGGATTGIYNLAAKIVNIFSVIVGIIAVLMIIYGGFKYITSGGDSGNISGAKNTLIYAIVGLVVVALAQFIVHFVLGQADSITTGNATQ